MLSTKLAQKVYLSGPISLGGTASPELTELYKTRFREIAKRIYLEGNIPLSPLGNEASSWQEFMRKGIAQLMGADSILMLPDWSRSKGADIERRIALEIGIPVKYVNG